MSSRVLLSLESTFGGIPSEVYNQIKYLTYNEKGGEFTCILCKTVIQKTAPKNLEAHLKSTSHKKISSTADEVNQALTGTFPSKIPQVVQNNIDVLDVVQEGYECVICDKLIEVSKDSKISVDNFSYHLTSPGHKEKLKDYDIIIEELEKMYGYIPEIVENNQEFLEVDSSGKNYKCRICNVLLKVNKNNMNYTESVFENHFSSPSHVWGTKCSKVYSLIPELQQSKLTIHTYLMRNIDYISTNGADIFCSLCHENIKRNPKDINDTMENLKHHILSSGHEENMFGRQNCDNIEFDNLSEVFGAFTDEVLKNLRYLELSENTFSCNICEEKIGTNSICDESNNNIISHIKSSFHESQISNEVQRRTDLIKKFEKIFSNMPALIEDNITFMEFIEGNRFQCTLCDVTVHLNNLESHLEGFKHTEGEEDKERISKTLDDELKDLLGEDYKDRIPECVYNNWRHIEFEEDSGNYCCILCDETILVDEGNKMEEITMQNFKRHLLSSGHKSKLKQKAKKEMKALDMLESVFGGIPKTILSNIQFLYENDGDSFICDLCNVEIKLGSCFSTTKQNFHQHLRGSFHRANVEGVETSIDNAFKFINKKFGVPEGLLRDVDFWDNSNVDPNVYCTLCQEDLSVDLNNLKRTRWSMECHVDSKRHKSNLEDL